MVTQKSLKTVDFFAGIGGIRIGFENAGFQTVFSNDFDSNCKITYDSNFDSPKQITKNINQIKSFEIPDFDILLAGFPCQPFSIAGYRKGFKDEGRGDLFFEIVRILRDKQPKAVFLENVKNLKTHDNGKTFKIISDALFDLGYFIKTIVLNSMYYGGLPQNRERIYIVGFSTLEMLNKFEFPEPIPLSLAVKDLLDKDVPEKYYYNKSKIYPELLSVIKDQGTVYQWRRKYVRENKRGVSPTLTANMGTGGHNVPLIKDSRGIRKLTPRECARLQGFNDDYLFPDSLPDSKIYKQIGNSVTIPVITRIARRIKIAMEL